MPGKKNIEQTSKETNTVMCFLFGNFRLKNFDYQPRKGSNYIYLHSTSALQPHSSRFSVCVLTLLISTFLRSTLVYS